MVLRRQILCHAGVFRFSGLVLQCAEDELSLLRGLGSLNSKGSIMAPQELGVRRV